MKGIISGLQRKSMESNARMYERLRLFLTGYESEDGSARFGCSELIRTAIDRLHALAAWTEDFARSNGIATLAAHLAMYRSHARWLKLHFAALCLCSCAINTANLETAKSMDQGKVRIAGGISSGLHLEEISYSELAADNVQKGGEPDKDHPYQRPEVITNPDLTNVLMLSAFSFHAGLGIGHDLELSSSVSAALMAASARIALKYQFYNHADYFYAALKPTALFAISDGASGPEDEITDGQQTFLQHILNDKQVFGVEFPVLMTWRTKNISYNLTPQLAYYNVNITKAFNENLTGNHMTTAAGVSAGTYFRLGNGAFGPELSLVVLDLFENRKIVNLNYAIGIMSDF